MIRGAIGKIHHWDFEEIKLLATGEYSTNEFAKMFGVTRATVLSLIKKHNISLTGKLKSEKKNFTYTIQDLSLIANVDYSIKELSSIFQVSVKSIHSTMQRYGIKNERINRRKTKEEIEQINKMLKVNLNRSYIAKEMGISLERLRKYSRSLNLSATKAYWSKEELEEVVILKNNGWTIRELAFKFKCSTTTISKISNGTIKVRLKQQVN